MVQCFFEKYVTERPFWRGGGEPNLLVDIWMMSNQVGIANRIRVELDNYKIENKDKNPFISYAISIIELNQMKNSDLSSYISRLKSLPKYPDIFAIGAAIEAISRADNEAFHQSINLLLEAHKGIAKRGSLRGTAEGLICLPAMSLGLLAVKRKMPINYESEYFSMGYLQFLMQH